MAKLLNEKLRKLLIKYLNKQPNLINLHFFNWSKLQKTYTRDLSARRTTSGGELSTTEPSCYQLTLAWCHLPQEYIYINYARLTSTYGLNMFWERHSLCVASKPIGYERSHPQQQSLLSRLYDVFTAHLKGVKFNCLEIFWKHKFNKKVAYEIIFYFGSTL